jgi:hypothetical protein
VKKLQGPDRSDRHHAAQYSRSIKSFDVCWNRRRMEWRRNPEDAPWLVEAIPLERRNRGSTSAGASGENIAS